MKYSTNQPQEQSILIASNSANPLPPKSELITTTLIYGGVAVAVIIAMTYFCSILLKRLDEILKNRKD